MAGDGKGIVKVAFKDAPVNPTTGHFGSITYRLQHKDLSGVQSYWVGMSYFLPDGGSEMSASESERVYFVISGSVVLVTEAGEEIVLNPMDSAYIPPGVKRAIVNRSKEPATMLVIATYGPQKPSK